MNPRLNIEFEVAEGAIIRMIGLIERRGFQVRGIGMSEDEEGETAQIMIEIEPRDDTRRVEVLDLQLRRIVGVRNVSTFHPPSGALS